MSDQLVESKLLVDIAEVDLSARLYGREHIEGYNPHRGEMSLLDHIVWESDDHSAGVALKLVRDDEFWVKGHYPGKPMFPGVLQVETGAQMACYLFNRRKPYPKLAAFLRIEHCSFRSMVQPGDELFILCRDVKFGRRQFVCDLQGLINGERIAFDARIRGMELAAEDQ